MFELLTSFVFVWLMAKAVGLAFRLTWGAARIVATILMALALPAMVICILFVGGIALIVPIAVMAVVVGILNSVV